MSARLELTFTDIQSTFLQSIADRDVEIPEHIDVSPPELLL